MSSALSAGSSPSVRLASAEAFFTMPNARTTRRPKRYRPRPIGKLSTDRCVCAPHKRCEGTATSPRASVSIRVSAMQPRILSRSALGRRLGRERVGARVEVCEVVSAGPGGAVAALMAEAHVEAAAPDQLATRADDLRDQRVSGAPPPL